MPLSTFCLANSSHEHWPLWPVSSLHSLLIAIGGDSRPDNFPPMPFKNPACHCGRRLRIRTTLSSDSINPTTYLIAVFLLDCLSQVFLELALEHDLFLVT